MQRLWTPWRMRYVAGDAPRDGGCILCAKLASAHDEDALILYRGEAAFVIMNLYPYNTGHVMVVSNEHAGDLGQLDPGVTAELFGLLPWVTEAQRRALRCDGLNIGLNLGKVAGAGIADHLHVHVVPRWEGDANFMPILANTMVLPELVGVTYAKLRAELELSGLRGHDPSAVVPQAGAIILLPGERKLALRRARDGSIVLPKGHIEPGESAWQAALREAREETGLEAEIAGWGGVLQLTVAGRERRVVHFIVSATASPELAAHLESDTLLVDLDDAVGALTHESSRALLREARERLAALLEVRR